MILELLTPLMLASSATSINDFSSIYSHANQTAENGKMTVKEIIAAACTVRCRNGSSVCSKDYD